MKITLIRPNMFNSIAKDAMQPLAFSVLSDLTPDDVELEFFDDRIEMLPDNLKTDLVAISIETFTARRAYQLSTTIRKQGIPVVMGGIHPTFMPQEALLFSDSVVIGEAESVWEKIIKDAKNNELKKIYQSTRKPSLKGIKFDRGIFKNKKYVPLIPVQFGRGCRNSCDFCSVNAFFGSSLRQRPVEEVTEEIQKINKKNIFFVDDNIFIDQDKTKKMLEAIIPLKIRWSSQASIDVANNPELLKLMKKSGCTSLIIGFETLDERNLKQMGKGVNIKNKNYKEAIKKLNAHGIMVYGTFVIGYDFDTKDTFEHVLEFALENKLMLANFNPLIPMPGTGLYKRLADEKRLIYNNWWNEPGYRYGETVFKPAKMTAEDLEQGCFDIRTRFNKYSSIAKRLTNLDSNFSSLYNAGVFIASNFISRKEIHKKQGMFLGDGFTKLSTDEVQV